MYKECLAGLRAAKYDEAAVKARAGIAAYPNAAWSRVCLLNAYSLNKSTPPDSIIAVGNAILAVDPNSLATFEAPAPFALFMRRGVWDAASTQLAEKYPRGRLRNVMPDGSRVVFEVPAA